MLKWFTICMCIGACAMSACGDQTSGLRPGLPDGPKGTSVLAQAVPVEQGIFQPAANVEQVLSRIGTSTIAPLPEGAQPALAISGQGSLILPVPGTAGSNETHMRHGFAMAKGHTRSLAIVEWSDHTWSNVKVDLGTGVCPHRGQRLASETASGGRVVVRYDGTPAPAQSGESWFLHVNADDNQERHAGDTLEYVYAVLTY